MPWWYAVIQSRHDIQNPTSEDKIVALGEHLCLGPASRVLDLAAGRGGPALVLARRFGCSFTCVERAPEFISVARFESAGVAPVGMIVSSQADWDRYESLHWLALNDWLRDNPDDPEAEEFRERGRRRRERYLEWERELLGWAILIGRVTATR